MLRRPSPSFSPAGSAGAPVLVRRGSSFAGTRRRTAGRDVPVQAGAAQAGAAQAGAAETRAATDPAAGVVPRMRSPRGTSGPATEQAPVPPARPTALDQRIERHLVRMQGAAHPRSHGTIDDDRARRDPDTTSFAAVSPDAGSPSSARVATAADRPRTAAFPAVPGAS